MSLYTQDHLPAPTIPLISSLPRYVITGLSVRGIYQYALPLLGITEGNPGRLDLSSHGVLAGIYDVDRERVEAFNTAYDVKVPYYASYTEMLEHVRPDTVIVAGPDFTHCEQITAALRAGCDVIAEKPMAITTAECQEIRAAERESGCEVKVAFNFRHTPQHRLIKDIIQSGRLGKITNIDFTYNLDTYHGANYFKRWNRRRALSGGLTVHKSCHHLDLIQWWVDSWPRQVFAYGARNYFGPDGWHNPDHTTQHPLTREEQIDLCPYHQYWQARKKTKPTPAPGTERPLLPYNVQYQTPRYIYDAEIDIEDTYAAVISYRNGVMMNYSCNFSAPWEGYTLGINGTLGRLETVHYSAPSRCTFPIPAEKTVKILPLFGPMEEIVVPFIEGGHGGADGAIQRDLFIGVDKESQRLNLSAGSLAGSYAVATGAAIWKSATSNTPVNILSFEQI